MSKSKDKNYYEILGLNDDCTQDDINAAYRKLAIKWHPDKHKNDKDEASKRFCEITNAYKILSDVETRKNYDKSGTGVSGTLIDPYEIFKEVFKSEDDDIPNIIVQIEANIEQLYTGFTEGVKFARYSKCDICNSTGTKKGEKCDCKKCKGKGIIIENVKGGNMGYMINEKQCEDCKGNGIDPSVKLCKNCKGMKYIQETIECDVDVPPGAYDNYYITLESEGNYIPKEDRKTKKLRTDVLIVIKEKTDPNSKFRRGMFINEINRINLADVLMNVTVPFIEAFIGIKKEFNYLGEQKIAIEIDEIIQNGDIHVIEGKGMPLVPEELNKVQNNKAGITHGDLFIQFKVEKPNLSKTDRNRIWQIVTKTAYPKYSENDDVDSSISIEEYIEKYKSVNMINNSKSDTNSNEDSNKDSSEDSDEDSKKDSDEDGNKDSSEDSDDDSDEDSDDDSDDDSE